MRSYSCLSRTHKTASRIDLAFVNGTCLLLIWAASYLAGGLSDHEPLLLTISAAARIGGSAWRLWPGWLQSEQVSNKVQTPMSDFWVHNPATTEDTVVWDSFKAVMRGQYIFAIKPVHAEHNTTRETLQTREQGCEREYAYAPSDLTFAALEGTRRQLALHDSSLVHTNLQHKAERLFEKGDKNGRLLAMLVAV